MTKTPNFSLLTKPIQRLGGMVRKQFGQMSTLYYLRLRQEHRQSELFHT